MHPGAGSCRRMLCQTGISRVSSSKRIGLSRVMLGSVGVKSGVKDRSQLHPLKFPGHALSWTLAIRLRSKPHRSAVP